MTRHSSTYSRAASAGFDPISGLLVIIVIFGSLSLSLPLLWTITTIIAGLTIVFFINRYLRKQRLQALRRQQLLALSPSEFEQRVALLLEDLGWKQVVVRGGSGDRGVDITAERDGLRFIIQCKRYSKPVGPNYVRDLVGALQIQQADRAILVTTSSFTRQSQLEARGQAVELWDNRILLQRIDEAERLRAAQQPRHNEQTALLFAGALGLNLVVAGIALLFSGLPVSSAEPQAGAGNFFGVAANAPSSNQAAFIPTTTTPRPTATPRPTHTPKPTVTPQATPTPSRPTATVFNGGNVRAEPNLKGTVLDQIHANETVTLLGRSADGVWIRIINPRQQEGWVHRTLLTLDPAIEAALPVIAPN
ncbi:restriction endonuclease [Chloroflexus sp.]|uniref:restriction endonuclease n=1 Tax=Chloroflexus sp. TaxID=1904827 RepID=UPI00298F0A6C|nr:restriction endonuclease [Chloroflexus sp.]MDW8405853.1 restriction endonuclease [Chloroflexus sp.]